MLLRDDLSQAIHDHWCPHAENAVLAFYTEVSCGASMTWVDEWKRRNKKKKDSESLLKMKKLLMKLLHQISKAPTPDSRKMRCL